MSELDRTIQRLQEIAKLNNDSFSYIIRIHPDRIHRFEFECLDQSGSYVFVSGRGDTPDEAVGHAEFSIESACLSLGYKET